MQLLKHVESEQPRVQPCPVVGVVGVAGVVGQCEKGCPVVPSLITNHSQHSQLLTALIIQDI